MTGNIFAFAPALCAFHFLYRRMDNAAFIGIHRFQRIVPADLNGLCGNLLTQRFQGFFSLFAVIANIQRNAVIPFVHMVGYQARQILQCIQGFPTVTNHHANIIARQR